jgi:hypothetical protein
MQKPEQPGGFFITAGRVALALAALALLCAWLTSITGDSMFGFSQQHFFSDATVLALLGIGFLLDGVIHRQVGV